MAKPGCLNSRANWLAHLQLEANKWRVMVGLHRQQALCNAVRQLMRLQARLNSHPGRPSACSIKDQCCFAAERQGHLCPCYI